MNEKEYIMEAPGRYGLDFDSDKNYISSFHHKKYLRKSTLDYFLETALDLKGLTASTAKREVKAEVILCQKPPIRDGWHGFVIVHIKWFLTLEFRQ